MCRTFRQREVLQIESLLNTHSLNGNTCALWSKTFPYNFEIRQRLLENNELTLDQAFDIANSFDMALEHSAAYLSYEKGLSAAAAVTPGDNLHANGSHCDSGSSARFLSHVSALFVLKLIMNVTAALLEMLFVIRAKREVMFHRPVDPGLSPSAVVSSQPSRHRQLRTCA